MPAEIRKLMLVVSVHFLMHYSIILITVTTSPNRIDVEETL